MILDASRRHFAEKGMDESTFRDIALDAGVSPASIVVHFKNKTALLEAALGGDIERTRAELIASVPKGGDVIESFIHISAGMFRLYDGNRDLYRDLLRQTMFEPADETPSITRRYDEYIRFFTGLVEKQKASGAISPHSDSGVVASSLFSVYLGALIFFFRMPEMTVESLTDILASMARQHLKGI